MLISRQEATNLSEESGYIKCSTDLITEFIVEAARRGHCSCTMSLSFSPIIFDVLADAGYEFTRDGNELLSVSW